MDRALRKDLLLLRAVLAVQDKANRLAGAARRRERTYRGYAQAGMGAHPEDGRQRKNGAQYFLIPDEDHGDDDPRPILIPKPVDLHWVRDRINEREFWYVHEHWDTVGDASEAGVWADESSEMAEKWEAVGRRAAGELPHLTAAVAASFLAKLAREAENGRPR